MQKNWLKIRVVWAYVWSLLEYVRFINFVIVIIIIIIIMCPHWMGRDCLVFTSTQYSTYLNSTNKNDNNNDNLYTQSFHWH